VDIPFLIILGIVTGAIQAAAAGLSLADAIGHPVANNRTLFACAIK